MLVIPQGLTSPDHPEELLYEDRFVCVVWRDARIAQGELSFDRHVAAGHAVMVPAAQDPGLVWLRALPHPAVRRMDAPT